MLVKRKSSITGKVTEMDLPITQSQLEQYELGNELIQDVFPELTPPQREFIKTGVSESEWNNLFRFK
jgi:hypothetical protein